MACIG
jgi:hypothetical protein